MAIQRSGRQLWKGFEGLLSLGALLLVTAGSAAGQTVTAVPKLDLNRYMGSWYEIARLPNKAERRCVRDVHVLYALADNKKNFQIGTSCQLQSGIPDDTRGTGKMDKAGDGKLKLRRLWPFTSPYWVLAVGPAYEWALVGIPNHKSLWILSRTPSLDAAVLAQIKATATAQGFDLAKLIVPPQDRS